jgi:hypothetical protein
MRKELASNQLADAVIQVLEDAAFLFSERVPEQAWESERAVSARLVIEHGEQMELCLCVEPELATLLAANLLALEPDSEEARASAAEAVGELANMLAGALSTELFGREVVSRIGVPNVVDEDEAEHARHVAEPGCRVVLRTDEGQRLDVGLAPPSRESTAP